jgi:galactokinase
MSLDVMAERSAELFAKCFGHAPRWLAAAPGRVNLIGEHTDYNEGFVLPMAIERHVVIAADRNRAREVTLHSTATGETAHFNLRTPVERGQPAWSNYIRGVIAGFQRLGRKIPGFDAVIDSGLPYGGGLASSAALEVATATLLEALCGRKLDRMEKAMLCQQAEHEYAGVPCGIMDQFTSVQGRKNHALLLDCRSRTAVPVKLADPEVTVLIINTRVRRRVADGEYAVRRSQCETAARCLKAASLRDVPLQKLKAARSRLEPIVFRRARHVLTENQRALDMARAIQTSDWLAVGQLMYASHASLRDDYEVSCRELDAVVEIAQSLAPEEGVIGCRMTGAGFGGCVVGLVKTASALRLIRLIGNTYERRIGEQAAIFTSRPAAGARLL